MVAHSRVTLAKCRYHLAHDHFFFMLQQKGSRRSHSIRNAAYPKHGMDALQVRLGLEVLGSKTNTDSLVKPLGSQREQAHVNARGELFTDISFTR
jgi:hypothetical protein